MFYVLEIIFINIVYEFKKQIKKFNSPVLNKVVKF